MEQTSKNGNITRKNLCKAFWVTMWGSIKYVITFITLSNSYYSKLTVSMYRQKISLTGSVRSLFIDFQYGHTKYHGLVFPWIILEQKITHIFLFSKHISSDYFSINVIILYFEQMQP